MENSSDTIGNLTRDLPACSAVPQPTATPAAFPIIIIYNVVIKCVLLCCLSCEKNKYLAIFNKHTDNVPYVRRV